ncbi:MAG: hypothetical protein ACI91O_001806 [Candidatus Poriferisodalaceae bacterium]|jgi:hypothetical protein
MPFVGSSSFSPGLAFASFAGEVNGSFRHNTGLGNRDGVKHRVDSPVTSEIEAMTYRDASSLTRRQRDSPSAAPSSELGLAGEPERVTDLAQQRRRNNSSDTNFVTQRGSMLIKKIIYDPFKAANLTAGGLILFDKALEPTKPITARRSGVEIDRDGLESPEAHLDLSYHYELVTNLGGKFGDP